MSFHLTHLFYLLIFFCFTRAPCSGPNSALAAPVFSKHPCGDVSRTKWRLLGHHVTGTPRGGWPIFAVRGVSQSKPTPNAPEAPRAIVVCLNAPNAHVPRNFYIPDVRDVKFVPIFATQVRIWACLKGKSTPRHRSEGSKTQGGVISVNHSPTCVP